MDDNRSPFFPPEALAQIRKGKVFSGGIRHKEIVGPLLPAGAEWISITVPLERVFSRYEEIFTRFEETATDDSIIVFASGDPLFFGFANTIKRKLPEADILLYPAFNSLQTLAHRLVMPYDDIRTVSLTGRPWQEFIAPQRPRKTDEELKAECGTWAAQGKPAGRARNIVTSLELQSEKMEVINKRLQEKYKALEENEVRYEAIECDDADYVIVAFGSSARICSATVEMARAEGLKVGLLRPITLYPFPKKQLAEMAARGVKGFLSAELNAGQMVEDVRLAVNGKAPVEHYGRQGGMMFNPDEVLDALKEKLIKK